MKFLTVFLASLGILGALYLALGCWIDPRGDFDRGAFPRVTMDARADKMRLFQAYHDASPVQGLVLGSSRSMKLNPQDFADASGERFFNFAVDSGRAEDFLAIYRWVRAQGAHPRKLVIGLDVESLHDNNRPDSRLERNRALVAALGVPLSEGRSHLQSVKRTVKRLKNVFTVDYVRDSTRSIGMSFSPPNLSAGFAKDGYAPYRDKEQQISTGTFDLDHEIALTFAAYEQRFGDMNGLSKKRKEYLETLINEAQQDGAEVIVWLTCLHPRTAEHLRQNTRYAQLLDEARVYLQELQQEHKILVSDYSEIGKFGGSLTSWYDGAHVAKTNATLIGAGLMRSLNARIAKQRDGSPETQIQLTNK